MSAGKGSARRPGKPGAYERGYKRIKWTSRRAPHEPKQRAR